MTTNSPVPTVKLVQYLRSSRENPNIWWTLDSGVHKELFDQMHEQGCEVLWISIQHARQLGCDIEKAVAIWEAWTGETWVD